MQVYYSALNNYKMYETFDIKSQLMNSSDITTCTLLRPSRHSVLRKLFIIYLGCTHMEAVNCDQDK